MTRTAVFAPFEIVEGDRASGLVLVADHARRDLPEEYGDLGLPASEFDRHIAYDIGVEMVTRKLAALTGAPAVIAGFSRLLIDPNRGEDDPTLIRQLYDGTVVPANYPMAPEERERRLDLFYRPYHDAVGAMVASVATASGKAATTSTFFASPRALTCNGTGSGNATVSSVSNATGPMTHLPSNVGWAEPTDGKKCPGEPHPPYETVFAND